jgi:hypothetical protein
MEVSDGDNARLGSLRELWHRVDQALTTQVIAPPQHVIEKIIIALEDARQWLDSQASNSPQTPSETYNDGRDLLGIDSPERFSTYEVFSLIM